MNDNLIIVILAILVLYFVKKVYGDTIIYYGRDTCPFCVKFNPVWAKIQQTSWLSDFNTEKVDTDTILGKMRMDAYKYKGVPTIVKIKNNIPEVYTGNRTYAEIMNWFNKPIV